MDEVYGNARSRFVIPVIMGSALAPYFVSAAVVPHRLETDESAIEAPALMIASYAAIGL